MRFLVSLVQIFSNFWTRLNNVSGFVSVELFYLWSDLSFCHPRALARRRIARFHLRMSRTKPKHSRTTLRISLRKKSTSGAATTVFPAKWRLRNELRNSILMTRHYSDLGSASDWLNQISHAARPIRSTTQIWVRGEKRHFVYAWGEYYLQPTTVGRHCAGADHYL